MYSWEMMVNNMIILIEDIVVAIQDGYGVHVLICGVFGIDKGVPEIGDGTEETNRLQVRIDHIGEAEGHTALHGNKYCKAIEEEHAEQHPRCKAVLTPLQEEDDGGHTCPVQEEA